LKDANGAAAIVNWKYRVFEKTLYTCIFIRQRLAVWYLKVLGLITAQHFHSDVLWLV